MRRWFTENVSKNLFKVLSVVWTWWAKRPWVWHCKSTALLKERERTCYSSINVEWILVCLPLSQWQDAVLEFSVNLMITKMKLKYSLCSWTLTKADSGSVCEASLTHRHFQILRLTVCDCCTLAGVMPECF